MTLRARKLAHKAKMQTKRRGAWRNPPDYHKPMRRHKRFLAALRIVIRMDATNSPDPSALRTA